MLNKRFHNNCFEEKYTYVLIYKQPERTKVDFLRGVMSSSWWSIVESLDLFPSFICDLDDIQCDLYSTISS